MRKQKTERNKLKNLKGKNFNKGITLIALIITIIFLLILAGVSIATLSGDNGILTKATKAKEETIKAESRELIELEVIGSYGKNGKIDIDELKSNLKDNLKLTDAEVVDVDGGFPLRVTHNGYSYIIEQNGDIEMTVNANKIETGGDNTWTRANGQIEIEFLTGTSYTVGQANKPKIDEKEMIPVNWDDTNKNWVVTDTSNWEYSYGDTDATKKWANVMLRDTLILENMTNSEVQTATIAKMKGQTVTTEGSMLVWLPRYAYRIIYFDTWDNENLYRAGNLTETEGIKNGSIVGYSDARGIVDVEGKTPEGMNSPVTSIAVGNNYRPHPAFETDLSQGGWSTKLEGIWMGKFETTEKVNDKITIQPNTASYTNQTIGTFYTDARNLGIANSHMAKNSEWGAMAYLTKSKYGRNGKVVTKNDAKVDSVIKTGEGDYKTNIAQSTTGNVYGIYDTVGGSNEYVAGYIADSSRDYGNSFASTDPEADDATNDKTTNTPYATVYAMAENNLGTDNYTANINNKFGDGIIETSTSGSSATSWYSGLSGFVGYDGRRNWPFFDRGGDYRGNFSSLFSFSSIDGFKGNGTGLFGFHLCASVQ